MSRCVRCCLAARDITSVRTELLLIHCQLFKNRAFYRNGKFDTVFTRARRHNPSQASSMQSTPSSSRTIHCKKKKPSKPRSSKWYLIFRISKLLCAFIVSLAYYIPRQSQPPWFDHSNIWWTVQIMQPYPSFHHVVSWCSGTPCVGLQQTGLEVLVKDSREAERPQVSFLAS
jgi:hypothetical protein